MLHFILKKPSKCVLKIAAHKPLGNFQKYFRMDINYSWKAADLKGGTKKVLVRAAFPINMSAAINSFRQKFCIQQFFLKSW